ncbi:beta-galactosidase 8-like [Pistacia vera]|uniref:beta-galactosidase 8-like n=1 Tax=Pistacia vera TaxID=55513 RepID=UPI001263832D|nr:beta-galactosidase 8-like [Pistacia vera]
MATRSSLAGNRRRVSPSSKIDIHEPVRNQYNFEGRYDMVKFMKLVAEAGPYVHLRIGPYVCAEWNYGGFPLWLHFVPGIELRTDNEPYKAEMQRFTTKIVGLLKQERNIMPLNSQEDPSFYHRLKMSMETLIRPAGLLQSQYQLGSKYGCIYDTGLPWVMRQQSDASDHDV